MAKKLENRNFSPDKLFKSKFGINHLKGLLNAHILCSFYFSVGCILSEL